MTPLVSINLCCYNGARYLRETLDSIIAQTFKDWELVFINDGSTDATGSIIEDYIRRGHPIIYRSRENRGLGYSRNEAIRCSQGQYLAFVDADDLWMPEKLEKQINLLLRTPHAGLVFCDVIFFDEDGRLYQAYKDRKPPINNFFRNLLSLNFQLNVETVIVRKACLDSLEEWFDPRFCMIEDHDLFSRVAYSWAVAYVDEPLAKGRIHRDSLSHSRPHLWPKERELMLSKFKTIYPYFEVNYQSEIEQLQYVIQREYAMLDWQNGNRIEFRKRLAPYLRSHPGLIKHLLASFLVEYSQYTRLQSCYRTIRNRIKCS